ncbi:MAG: hypothetical protein MJ188_05135 [Treponema sp.]|nr:hypothetical protein [Treponema sp.]
MKKALCKKKWYFFTIFLLVQCFSFLTLSCGLDVYIVINPPVRTHTAYYDSNDFTDNYFSFDTNPNNDSTGTEVYYKIYNTYSLMSSESGNISNYSSNDDYKAQAYDKLKSYSYQLLKIEDYNESPIIPHRNGSGQKVKIRLTDYQYSEEYSASMLIGDDKVGGKPIRSGTQGYNFNFGRVSEGENTRIPQEGDEDLGYSTSTSSDDNESDWYVVLFAVNVKLNADYTYTYSCPEYLGCVKINSSDIDN